MTYFLFYVVYNEKVESRSYGFYDKKMEKKLGGKYLGTIIA